MSDLDTRLREATAETIYDVMREAVLRHPPGDLHPNYLQSGVHKNALLEIIDTTQLHKCPDLLIGVAAAMVPEGWWVERLCWGMDKDGYATDAVLACANPADRVSAFWGQDGENRGPIGTTAAALTLAAREAQRHDD